MNITTDPWKYAVIDHVFTDDLFLKLNKFGNTLAPTTDVYDIATLVNNGLMTPDLEQVIIQFADNTVNKYVELMTTFSDLSPYGYLCKPQIHTFCNYSSKLTTEQYKSFIYNICIAQSSQYTVDIYDNSTHCRTESVNLNQGFMFCPAHPVTWHQTSSKLTSVNLYLYFSKLDNWFDNEYRKENLLKLDPIVLKWQTNLFNQGLLIRSPYDIKPLLV